MPVWLLRLRVLLLYRWRRGSLSVRVPDRPEPDHRQALPPIDTGGAYRATFGSQFGDPSEGHSSPHSEGSNCTMAAAGMAMDHHTGGAKRKRGGDMRHHQGDNDGGTDLYDAADAWASYGESLAIKSGQGWGKVVSSLNEGRGVILQGTGGLAGCGDFDGAHAIYVAPEHNDDGWVVGDPECSGYQRTKQGTLEAWAERLSSGVYFAVTKAKSAPPPPTPVAAPCPPVTLPGPELERAADRGHTMALDEEVGQWLAFISYRGADSWDVAEWGCSHWARQAGAIDPLTSARIARDAWPAWGEAWRQVTWA